MVPERAMGNNGPSIGQILKKISKMVSASKDKRATALAELKQAEAGDPFKILIGTVLSHRTRDESTSKATERLFQVYDTPEKLANADVRKVKELIRSVGFYNVKSRNVIRVAKQVVEEFGGRVPDDLESLLTLHAVGRKTANCVLVYGFNKPAIPVDTHVHRIANRLGLVQTKTPEQTEEELTKTVPKRYWLELNELFVRFGQTTCKPIGPRCDICTLTANCRYYREVVAPSSPA
ncbi:MAG: endonuclease III [Thaumarchaeota archaeon]|nr:endonuclease III [Nitrososphaerota archaeon]